MNRMTFEDTYRDRKIICEKQNGGWIGVGNIGNVEIRMDETWEHTRVAQFCEHAE